MGDHTAPALHVAAKPKVKLQALLKSGYTFGVSCDESCDVNALLQLSLKDARKRGLASGATVGRASMSMPRAGSRKLTVRLTRKAARKLRGARGLTITLRVAAEDPAGNSASRSVKLRLR